MATFNNPRNTAATATASATLARGFHTPVDATSGARTMTLPTTAPAGVEISVEKVDTSANAVTVSGTLRGAAGTIPLTSQYEARTFLSEGSGSWRPVSDHRTKASLDAAYAGLAGTQTFTGAKTFTGPLTTGQGIAQGAYIGNMVGIAGVALSDGTNTWSIDNNTGTLRFMKTGNAQIASLNFAGDFSTLGRGIFSDGLTISTKSTAKNRIGVGFGITINGSNLDTTLLSDKVGFANSLTIKGDFTGESARGLSNPNFIWGANDFIVTGSAPGDAAGLQDLWGRLSEVHLYTPNHTTLNTLIGFEAESNIEASATGSVVQTLASARFIGPHVNAGSAVNAYGLFVSQPSVTGSGTITGQNYALYVAGSSVQTGAAAFNGGASVFGAFTQASGSAWFTGASSTGATVAAGVYVGNISGNYGVQIANGTNAWSIDNNTGTLRFMRAGVQENASITLAGDFKVRNGFSVFNTALVTSKPSVTGSRGGNAALASLLTALATYGLITDSSVA